MGDTMPPIILVLLQGLFLLLLYLFLARAVRAVIRDVRLSAAPTRQATAPRPAPARPAGGRATPPSQRKQPRRRPTELVVHLSTGKPRVIPLHSEEISFGRSSACTVPLDDSYASERHARVYRTDGGWMVADMGSTNGTYLNQAKVTAPAPLQAGDQVAIGKTVVEVRR